MCMKLDEISDGILKRFSKIWLNSLVNCAEFRVVEYAKRLHSLNFSKRFVIGRWPKMAITGEMQRVAATLNG